MTLGTSWGPSTPFDPEEAKWWAERWIGVWKSMSDEFAKNLFPYDASLHQWDSPFGRGFQVEQLQKLVQQAECAARHQVQMTIEMQMG